MGRGPGGKERPYSGVSPRYGDRERRSGWGVAPPSRKLWVGNLSSHITESALSEEFLRFGDIESIAYIPGRSYAFVNFRKEEDAVLALRALHGSNVAGMPLRIEFAKGDESYLHHKDGRRSMESGEPPLRRDLRTQDFSPKKSSVKSKDYQSAEPSEVLWIGFPSSLNVDEVVLRRAFSAFGELDKITTFPGRSYAFIRYRSVVAACRAKEALHGKFLNNPRVNICFAKNDIPTEHGKGLGNGSFSHLKSNYSLESSGKVFDPLHDDESFESPARDYHRASPPFGSSFDRVSGDPHTPDLARHQSSRFDFERESIFSSTYEDMRLREFVSDRRESEGMFERSRISSADKIPSWPSYPFERSKRVSSFGDSWDIEDRSFSLVAKKHKIDSNTDKDLPEYPFAGLKHEKHDSLQTPFSDRPLQHDYNKPFDSARFSLKDAHDFSRSLNHPHADIDDSWGNTSRSSAVSRPLPNNSPKLHRSNSDSSHKPPPVDEIWKWEGTIAKGGTPVFRARCFPVGKVLDFMLPEFLNCTARTGLDMLAKHYFQAVCTWVVFFVPESDADISFYNEFMHYLGEKQRAAVAKLGEIVTLFLVPPSDFSEQVLKVPGKVSISGVILKFQENASNFSSSQHPMDLKEPKFQSLTHRPREGLRILEGNSFLKPNSPDFKSISHNQNHVALSSYLSLPPLFKRDDSFPYSVPIRGEKLSDVHMDGSHDQLQSNNPSFTSKWSSSIPASSPGMGSIIATPNAALKSFNQFFSKELADSRVATETDSSSYMPETLPSTSAIKFLPPQDIKSQASSVTSRSLQPEQLVHLTALLGNQKQMGEELPFLKDEQGKYLNMMQNPSTQSHTSMLYNNSLLQYVHASIPPVNSASVGQQSGNGQALQLQEPQPTDTSPVENIEQTNQQEPNSIREGNKEVDPEKRLQATLQLAAALLQQIQQRSKAAD